MKTPTLIAIFLAIFALTTHAATQPKSGTGKKPAAQTTQQKPAAGKKQAQIDNWISGEVSILGFGVRYERMMAPDLSIGAEAYWNTLIFWNDWGVIAFGRFYPTSSFFLEVGLGYNYHTGDSEWEYDIGGTKHEEKFWTSTSGFVISPGAGLRIDPGRPGGFFIQPGIKFPITIGTQKPIFNWFNLYNIDNRVGATFGVVVYCGFGGAF